MNEPARPLHLAYLSREGGVGAVIKSLGMRLPESGIHSIYSKRYRYLPGRLVR